MKPTLTAIAAVVLFGAADLAAQSNRAELLAANGRADPAVRYDAGHPRHGRRDHDYRRFEHRGGRHHDHRYHGARLYAEKAVHQTREARRLGYYSDHPRWSTRFGRHFHWALNASRHRLEREEYRRATKLRELRAYRRHSHRRYYGHG